MAVGRSRPDRRVRSRSRRTGCFAGCGTSVARRCACGGSAGIGCRVCRAVGKRGALAVSDVSGWWCSHPGACTMNNADGLTSLSSHTGCD